MPRRYGTVYWILNARGIMVLPSPELFVILNIIKLEYSLKHGGAALGGAKAFPVV